MKLIVGLGNPGPQYTKTRHNVGFMVVDRLVGAHGTGEPVKAKFQAATIELSIRGERCLLLKPTTFMNLCGRSVGEAVRFLKLNIAADLLIVVDDLYLPTGQLRIKPAGSAGGHNGLTSIEQLLATDSYPRLRIGVGMQPSGGKPALIDQADFVLSRFSPDEEFLLEGSIVKAAKAIEAFASKGVAYAMNLANTSAPGPLAAPPSATPIAKKTHPPPPPPPTSQPPRSPQDLSMN